MEEDRQVSKFSSGIQILIRLDRLWSETHSAVKAERYYLWNTLLDRVWCELSRDLPEKEYEGWKKKFDGIYKKISDSGKIVDNVDDLGIGFKKVAPDFLKRRANQYKLLMEKELLLRRLENHLGKGTTWNDEDEDDFD